MNHSVEYIQINKNKKLEYKRVFTDQSEGLIIETLYTGICSSDLKIIKKGHPAIRYPVIPGHEIVGRIKRISDRFSYLKDQGFKEGDIVQVYPGITCSRCKYCQSNRQNLCESIKIIGFNYPGGFSSLLAFKNDLEGSIHLTKIKTANDDLLALYVMAEPVSCLINVFENIPLYHGDRLLIIGAGFMGQLGAIVALNYGIDNIFLIDPSLKDKDKNVNQYLKDTLKKDRFLSMDDESEEMVKIRELKPDIVLIATSNFESTPLLPDAVSKGGRICYFSGTSKKFSRKYTDSIGPNIIHYGEIFIRGFYGNTPIQNQRAVELITKNKKIFTNFIQDAIYPVQNYREAFKRAFNESGKKFIFSFIKEKNNNQQ